MAEFTPSQPPELFRKDPYLLRWYNELIKRIGVDTYTAEELDSGQLDNRYYTETEVDALLEPNYQLITSTYTLPDDDYLIECDGTFTVTLHTPAKISEYQINNIGDGKISISGTVQNDSNFTLYPDESISLFWNGSAYLVT